MIETIGIRDASWTSGTVMGVGEVVGTGGATDMIGAMELDVVEVGTDTVMDTGSEVVVMDATIRGPGQGQSDPSHSSVLVGYQ